MKFWVGDGLVDQERALVPVVDHGFTVGDGVFETLRTVSDDGVAVVPFAIRRHIERLAASAAGMGLPAPDPERVRSALTAVCAANQEAGYAGQPWSVGHAGSVGRLRVTWTAGSGGRDPGGVEGAATLVVTASGARQWPAAEVLARVPWPRNERSPLVGLKSTSYAENVMALARARAVGAGEGLLLNLAGQVCEGTGSNVFAVIDGTAVTPALSSGCLPGITRALVLEWSTQAGLDVVEQAFTWSELLSAREVFITSSTRNVHPVSEMRDVRGNVMWSGVVGPGPVGGVGPVTARIAAEFAARSAADADP